MQNSQKEIPRRILVTGGSGFIGSNLLRFLLANPSIEVLNFDALTYAGLRANTRDLEGNPRYHFSQGDLRDRDVIFRAVAAFAPCGIIHLAAESHVDRSIDYSADCVQTNVIGTQHLLEAARAYWEGLTAGQRERFRILHLSTDEVFGSLERDAPPFTETSPYDPRSPYAASKAAGDHLVSAWWHTYGLPTVISHSANNYGPWQFPEKLVPLTILKALRGEPIPLYGDGLQIRDWIHVSDHVRALYGLLCEGRPGQRYLIGACQESTNLEWVRRICRCLDACAAEGHPALEKLPADGVESLIHFVADRPGHDRRYALNTDKIRNELGWAPKISADGGLRQCVVWYLEHAGWWKPILESSYDLERLGKGEL